VFKVDIVVVAIENPILIGIYRDKKLIETISSNEMASDSIPKIFADLMDRLEIDNILFANGPGSFMAIKVSYIFLKSLSILTDIKLWSVDGFYFNRNSPIKAFNNHYFVKSEKEIEIKKIESPEIEEFKLPEEFKIEDYSSSVEPIYILPAV